MSSDTMAAVWFLETRLPDGRWRMLTDVTGQGQIIPFPFPSRDRAAHHIELMRKAGYKTPLRIVRFKRHKEVVL